MQDRSEEMIADENVRSPNIPDMVNVARQDRVGENFGREPLPVADFAAGIILDLDKPPASRPVLAP
jgi:hypothetical protein